MSMQDVCPIVQLFEQVREQLALGALPEQACGAAHSAVDATNAHLSASTEQVARGWPSWQVRPVPVQIPSMSLPPALAEPVASSPLRVTIDNRQLQKRM